MDTSKPTNPKDALGSNKVPIHLWPNTATLLGAMGLLDGACKYGRSNFRAIGVRASIYYDAARRHLDRWFEGEDVDPDSGLPHLAHALASIAIIVDAQAGGKLTDDRMFEGGFHAMLEQLTPMVAQIKAKYADKSPHHYTIEDSRCAMAEHAARENDARLVADSNSGLEGWLPHNVSGMPAIKSGLVSVILRSGERETGSIASFDWTIRGEMSDICFYLPLNQPELQASV